MTGPLAVTITMKTLVGAVPLLPGPGPDRATSRRRPCSTAPTATSNPVGTGPFVFPDWVPNSHMTATGNPHYWRKGYPYLSSITYKPIIDPNSRADALQTGRDRHHAHQLPRAACCSSGATRSTSYYDNSGQVVGQPTVQCIMLNTSTAPFNNKTLRMAMAMCINQAAVLQGHRQGRRRPDERPLPPGQRVLHQDRLPQVRPDRGGQAGQAGAAADGQAGRRSPSTRPATRTSCGPPSSCSRPSSRPA